VAYYIIKFKSFDSFQMLNGNKGYGWNKKIYYTKHIRWKIIILKLFYDCMINWCRKLQRVISYKEIKNKIELSCTYNFRIIVDIYYLNILNMFFFIFNYQLQLKINDLSYWFIIIIYFCKLVPKYKFEKNIICLSMK
jgi:hypothetical protein